MENEIERLKEEIEKLQEERIALLQLAGDPYKSSVAAEVAEMRGVINSLKQKNQQFLIACKQAFSALNIAAGENNLYVGERVLLKSLIEKK